MARAARVIAFAAFLTAFSGCSERQPSADRILVRVEPGDGVASGDADTARIHLIGADGSVPAGSAVYGVAERDIREVGWPIVFELFPAGRPELISPVTVRAVGLAGGAVMASAEVETSWKGGLTLTLRLDALPGGCDSDADGFLDCTKQGCCPSAASQVFGDCGPGDPDIHPGAVEDPCEPCADVVDQDCDGADQPCIDDDKDGIADCAEAACGANDALSGPGMPERCDGVDNDCDSETDEGFHLGEACDSDDDSDSCAFGLLVCGDDGLARCADDEPPQELCNGVDDNCDGQTDEGLPVGNICGVGACKGGVRECTEDGLGTLCSSMPGGSAPRDSGEVCNSADDDCDNLTDEDFPTLGMPCDGADADLCKDGTWTCAADGLGVVCVNEPAVATYEVCDGKDNDCDGETDELWPLLGQPCDGPDTDFCAFGTWRCQAGGDGVECTDETIVGLVEQCTGNDDDCDLLVDDDDPDCGCGLVGAACPDGFTCVASLSSVNPGWDYCAMSGATEAVYVPAGAFWMGCDSSRVPGHAPCPEHQQPLHLVTVPAFVITRTEVSSAAYEACSSGGSCPTLSSEQASSPRVDASRDNAASYCAWLASEQGTPWRLCTESEWEKAGRGACDAHVVAGWPSTCGLGPADPIGGPTVANLPWGSSPTEVEPCDLAHTAGCQGDERPVGAGFEGASIYGVVDLVGNVWEWVEDTYASDYASTPTDGSAYTVPGGGYVVRGGSFLAPADARTVTRASASGPASDTGFRC